MGKDFQIDLQMNGSKSNEAVKYLQFELDKLNKHRPIMKGEILINTTHVVEEED